MSTAAAVAAAASTSPISTAGVAASFDEITEMIVPNAGPETISRRIRGSMWKMEDRSDTGCRLTAPDKQAPAKLGELLALKEGETWALAVVRRMQRHHVDETTVGVEIIEQQMKVAAFNAMTSGAELGDCVIKAIGLDQKFPLSNAAGGGTGAKAAAG
jgi:hypothetical protein